MVTGEGKKYDVSEINGEEEKNVLFEVSYVLLVKEKASDLWVKVGKGVKSRFGLHMCETVLWEYGNDSFLCEDSHHRQKNI